MSGTCPEFGVSGSGIVREWRPRVDASGDVIEDSGVQYQYSFVGPLSMSKGCDLTADNKQNRNITARNRVNIPEFVYRGSTLYLNLTEIIFRYFMKSVREIKRFYKNQIE